MKRSIPVIGVCLSIVLLGSALPRSLAAAQTVAETATGVVFEDLDGDGQRDGDEPGVADVAVSNGRDVVTTDADGRYEIDVVPETIIFITKPSGYMVPVDEQQLPQFFYRHYPQGSTVETFYPGVEPTGPLPDAIDFPLVARDESGPFDAVVFADPQTRNAGELQRFKTDVVDELVGIDADFGVTVGDIVNDPLDLFEPHNEIVATIGIPWWNVPGNHDVNYDSPDDEHSTETYKRVYGPTTYSADYGDVHFVYIDNVDYFGEAQGGYRGYINATQLEWLAADLALVPRDELVVIATHIPLRTEAIGGASLNTVNLDELFEVLDGREHVYAISGHDTSNSWQMYMEPGELRTPPPGVNPAVWDGPDAFHSQTLAEVRGSGWTTGPLDARGVQAADMSDGNPNGYYVITFDGNDYRPRFKPASLPADYQMRITFRGGGDGTHELSDGDRVWLPGGASGVAGFAGAPPLDTRALRGNPVPERVAARVPVRAGDVPQVEVNVFDGGERHVVEASIDGGEFVPMHYDPPRFGLTGGQPGGNLDPYIRGLRETLVGSERPAAPEPSSHLWTLPLPRTLRPGPHTVTVRSTDPYGQVSQATETFEAVVHPDRVRAQGRTGESGR